jgi:PAS domain S-box-containing protein
MWVLLATAVVGGEAMAGEWGMGVGMMLGVVEDLGWAVGLVFGVLGVAGWWMWLRSRREGVEGAEDWRRVFEDSPVAQWVVAMTGEVLEANGAARRLRGWAEDRTGTPSLEDWVPSDLLEEVAGELGRLASGERVVETLRLGVGGKLIEVELRGRAVCQRGRAAVVIQETDVTERNHELHALREIQLRHHSLVRAIGDGVILMDVAGKVETLNPGAEAILGVKAEELIGRSWDLGQGSSPVRRDGRVYEPEELPVAWTLRTGEALEGRVMGLPMEGTAPVWLLVSTLPLKRDPAGRVMSMVLAFTDISEQIRTQEELKRAKEAAEAASRAKTEFLAHVGHEVRTPLNGLTSAHDLLLQSGLTSEQREYLMNAVESVDDMLTLLDDLLDLTKIEAGRLTVESMEFDLRNLVENTLRTFRPKMVAAGLVMRVTVEDTLSAWVRGDPHRLRQVLANLLSNAIKFTPKGSVDIRVRAVEGDRVRFTVSDTGIGIDQAKLGLVFEAFEQADVSISRRFGGTGLGLAICRKLMGLMGGTIWAESEPDRGSRFHIELPLPAVTTPAGAVPGVGLAAAPATPASLKLASTVRILIVEDHSVNRQLTETMVRETGATTETAQNGRQAVERLEKGEFALVLMDVQMPEMDGMTATRIWREHERKHGLRRVPIVALTAHTQAEDRELCLASGMDDYLSKPLRRNVLMGKLEEHLLGVQGKLGGLRQDWSEPAAGWVGGRGMSEKLRGLLRDANREGMRAVREEMRQRNPVVVARKLHFLKGGCGLLHDEALIRSLEEAEAMAKKGRWEELEGVLPGLERQMEAAVGTVN